MTAKCLFVSCKKPVAFRVVQLWNKKIVHVCAEHVPGNGGKYANVPNPTEPTRRGVYDIFPLATS